MAIKNKTDLTSDINSIIPSGGGGNVTNADLNGILIDMVDSYEDIIQEYTTAQRDALTPFEGQKIYNTTSNRLEYYSASQWMPCSQKEVVAVDCSGTPNYPEALVGDQYIVSVAGKIGGASGKTVYVGDLVYCIVDNAGGTEAGVGTSWAVCHSEANGAAQVKRVSLTIATADVLTLNSVPITIIPAVTGKAIQVIGGNISATYNSTTYASNVVLIIQCPSLSTLQAGTSIAFTGDIYRPLEIVTNGAANDVQMKVNEAVQVSVSTGNPTTGNSDITITLFYIEV